MFLRGAGGSGRLPAAPALTARLLVGPPAEDHAAAGGNADCGYEAPSPSGTASDNAHPIAFSAQHFTKVSGSGLRFADGYFTATYAPVTDGAGTVSVD